MLFTNDWHKVLTSLMETMRKSGRRSSLRCWSCQWLVANRQVRCHTRTPQPKDNMASQKKKASARTSVKFKDLKSKKNPKGGAVQMYVKNQSIEFHKNT